MRNMPSQWPSGTGQWEARRTLVMGGADVEEDADVVMTPLDLITRLEREPIHRVVLGRAFAELAAALRELYPRVGVVAM